MLAGELRHRGKEREPAPLISRHRIRLFCEAKRAFPPTWRVRSVGRECGEGKTRCFWYRPGPGTSLHLLGTYFRFRGRRLGRF